MVIGARRLLLVRTTYLVIAVCYAALMRLSGRAKRKAVVLCYHAVTEAQRERFRRQMQHIAERSISVDNLASGKAGVCVTFDDAFSCLLTNALPVVDELGIPVVIFAVSGNLGRPPSWSMPNGHPEAELPTMSEGEMRAVAKQPLCTFGSHTVSHRPLALIPLDEAERELMGSRAMLQEVLATPVKDLALPHGSYDTPVLAVAARVYRHVFTLDATTHPANLPPGAVGRFLVSPDMWPLEFRLTAAGAYAWLYPFRQLVARIIGRPPC